MVEADLERAEERAELGEKYVSCDERKTCCEFVAFSSPAENNFLTEHTLPADFSFIYRFYVWLFLTEDFFIFNTNEPKQLASYLKINQLIANDFS